MGITLSYISKHEHELVENAERELGNFFTHAHDMIFFTSTFISSITNDAFIFSLFLSQITNSLLLCLLSTLRNHDVQYNMMLRHVLENASLACYALYETNTEVYYRSDEDDDDILYPKESARKKAYRWLEDNYPNFSAIIKNMKNTINDSFAHASIASTPFNVETDGNTIGHLFFDKSDKLMQQTRLWWVGNVALEILREFEEINQKYPKIKLVEDFKEKMLEFTSDDISLLSYLTVNPRLSRWIHDRLD